MILLAYDGSEDAGRAIATAGALVSGRAVVLHVASHESEGLMAAPHGAGAPMGVTPLPEEREQEEARARGVADQGRRLAADAGFDAEPQVLRGGGARGVREAILSAADEHDASVIVLGRRGMGPVTAALLGSVSDSVVRHARRPVLVVPPPPD